MGTDPEDFVSSALVAADHAATVEGAIMTVAVEIARPGDWIFLDETARLTPVGSERFVKHFPIQFDNGSSFRQDYEDEKGKAFRWVYRAKASLNERVIFAEGRCNSSDFVSKDIDGNEQPDAIDEGGVMGAALSGMQSSGIKGLLGLRNVRIKDLESAGMDVAKMIAEDPAANKGKGQ